jgi:SAM-dependent methyltransferase
MKINCLLCAKECDAVKLLGMPQMPSCAQNLPSPDNMENDKAIDFSLVQCRECGLVQLDCSPVDYYRDVIRAGGNTLTMKTLRQNQYRQFIDMADLKGKRILEVGCGAGEFLSMITEFPVIPCGIENNECLVNKARLNGLDVYNDFADTLGHKIKGAPYDAFVQFNFIEHQPRPNDMVQCIRDNLVEGGWGLVTAPSFEYIEHNCVYEVMRDHIAYYTEETLACLFVKNGFDIVRSERINGGDTLSIIVRKRRMLVEDAFDSSYRAVRKNINDFIQKVICEGKKIAFWGASHQCFTAAAFLENPKSVSCIVDSAPFKQGCISPVSHIPIISPSEFYESPAENVLIVAPGYTDEIAGIIRGQCQGVTLYALRTDQIECL